MNIIFEVVQLGLEALVLSIVVYHIFHMNRSISKLGREFSDLSARLGSVVEKVDELDRADLLRALVSTAANAKRSIIHYTYTFHLPHEEPEMGPLLEVIDKSKLPRENIRFLGPDYRDNIDRLYSRKKTGVQLRVSPAIRDSDLRFQVCDGKNVVLTIGTASEPSRRGFLIESVFLASILTCWFDEQWARSVDYEEFIIKKLEALASVPQIMALSFESKVTYISDRLKLDCVEVERVLKMLFEERPNLS
jgi:hypothetical protein